MTCSACGATVAGDARFCASCGRPLRTVDDERRVVISCKLDEIAPKPSQEFLLLRDRYPAQFKKYYGEANTQTFHEALRLGRDTYIAEACWHCHSQFVRPVSNEDARFGKVSWAGEYQNEMFLPHLFGTPGKPLSIPYAAGQMGGACYKQLDALAIAPYFGYYVGTGISTASISIRSHDNNSAIASGKTWQGVWVNLGVKVGIAKFQKLNVSVLGEAFLVRGERRHDLA